MEKDTEVTEVIFRKFKNGRVLALFPYLTERTMGDCMSYMLLGQHGGASLSIVYSTKLATEEEYKSTYSELTNDFGYNLKIIKKVNWNKYRTAYYKDK